jgi:hypothetical protein
MIFREIKKEINMDAKKKALSSLNLSLSTLRLNFFDFIYEDGMI